MPTQVVAPRHICVRSVEYLEVQPSDDDISLSENVHQWTIASWKGVKDGRENFAAVLAANDVAAASRFLDLSHVTCRAFTEPIMDDDLYLGRSVLLLPAGFRRPVAGWIASSVEPFDVIMLSRPGVYKKITVDADCLGEDGSIARVLREIRRESHPRP